MRREEDAHQRALFEWAALVHTDVGPLRDHIFAIPNGGARRRVEASILKGLGVTPGVSDVFVMIPSGKWHGMFCELKARDGRPSDTQQTFVERARARGYHAGFYYDWEDAATAIRQYLAAGGHLLTEYGRAIA